MLLSARSCPPLLSGSTWKNPFHVGTGWLWHNLGTALKWTLRGGGRRRAQLWKQMAPVGVTDVLLSGTGREERWEEVGGTDWAIGPAQVPWGPPALSSLSRSWSAPPAHSRFARGTVYHLSRGSICSGNHLPPPLSAGSSSLSTLQPGHI